MFRKTVKKVLAFMIVATLCLTSLSFNVFAEALTGVQDGSAALEYALSSGMTVAIESNGIGGKQAGTDPYYKLTGDTSSSYIQPYANNSVLNAFTWEMSFMLPEDSSAINMLCQFLV